MNIDEILKSLVGKKITINYTQHQESILRETCGILKHVNEHVIEMNIYNSYGDFCNFYLNRHCCVLLSISNEDKI